MDTEKVDYGKKYGYTKDGQFACSLCKGEREVEIGQGIGNPHKIKCPCCGGSGYLVDSIMSDIDLQRCLYEQERDRNKILVDWIKASSKCKICGGDQKKTLGGTPCKECGLPGTQPWGG